jgi:N-methylhydantoinase A/oxoprolinase/acetone carboxylase beta subunit
VYSVDIDTGGTMTDTLVSGGPQPLVIKVESTPHDVTVSFVQSLEAAAAAAGSADLTAFLEQVDLIRWSSTITSNVLAQRTGPKLGLLVTAGYEDSLYAKDPAHTAAVVPSLVRREHIDGLPPDADRATIIGILKRLIDHGIRRINVSLEGAFPDGRREQEILGIIGEQFPDHYLGSVPALAGSDMLMRPDDMSRTFFALINSYVHNSLANSLFKAEDLVKVEHNWKGDILVGHLNGGVARIGKTKAVDTIESGPLFGTHASAWLAAAQQLPKVLAVDIGGTTAKASAVLDGRIEMRPEGHFFGIPVRTPMPVLRSIALGGGSVARAVNGRVELGPESMGAAPGPACYKLGGSKATLTDALVLLGLLSPTGFLNGRRVLDVDLAATAVEKHVASPLGLDVPSAARRILDCAIDMMSALAHDTLAEVGHADDGSFVMFAYGGNGPMFATEVAERLGLREVHLFALGTIFSAYGSAIADVLHVYERAFTAGDLNTELLEAGSALQAQAMRDLAGEGFDPARAHYEWEIDGGAGARANGRIDVAAPLLGAAGPGATLLRLTARFLIDKQPLPERPAASGDSQRGTRPSPLATGGALPVHAHEGLIGRSLDGPLVVDGGTFTWYVGPQWRLTVDARGDARVTRNGG